MAKGYKSELHLFIIWSHARTHQSEILASIRERFQIYGLFEVFWSKADFATNLSRFYGTKLPPGSGKQQHIGDDSFLAVVVYDHSPEYREELTSRGPEVVNSRTFHSKAGYRELTGGGHRIHATNSHKETEHDLALLFGLDLADFKSKYRPSMRIRKLKSNLVGTHGWNDLEQLFTVLGATQGYVVMRNFEPLPSGYYLDKHGDIDLLVEDYNNTCFITNSKPVFSEPFRVHNSVKVRGQDVLFDFRHFGDEYYDQKWQKDMITNRRKLRGFYKPSAPDHYFGLLYHALIHKPELSPDYLRRLKAIALRHGFPQPNVDSLAAFMAKNGYSLTRPIDLSVQFNEAVAFDLHAGIYRRRRPVRARAGALKRYLKSITQKN
jgi:hypothetical protein